MGLIGGGNQWKLSDELWEKIKPLIPKPIDNHPLGCHRHRVPNRKVMEGILFVLKTGCQWKALDATGICSGSTAHRRFQEWVKAGVFERFWQEGLLAYDELKGIDWRWMSADGSMQKAPLSKTKKNRAQSHRQGQTGSQA
jgi:transposase